MHTLVLLAFSNLACNSYGVKELLLDVCKALLGDSVQLTNEVDMEKAKIDKVSRCNYAR